MSDYPPFGSTNTCPKCHGSGTSITFRPTACLDMGGSHAATLGPPDEHMCRQCSGCGYCWDEATADA